VTQELRHAHNDLGSLERLKALEEDHPNLPMLLQFYCSSSDYLSTNVIRNIKIAHYNNSIKTLLNLIKLYRSKAQDFLYLMRDFEIRTSRIAKVDKIDLGKD